MLVGKKILAPKMKKRKQDQENRLAKQRREKEEEKKKKNSKHGCHEMTSCRTTKATLQILNIGKHNKKIKLMSRT